jgi:hypothetical protein
MKNRLRKVQFKYLDYLFENICWVKSKFYPDSTFFKKGDKVILELEKSGTLWVLYSVWSNISDMFSFDYNETQKLIKEWMEAQLKLGEVAPNWMYWRYFMWMEAQLKSVEIAPLDAGSNYLPFMEKQIKQGEIEPDCNFNTNIIRVQEELKSVEIKPNWRIPVYEGEEELEQEEVTPRSAIPPQSWTNLKSEEIKPVKFYENELQVFEEQLKQEILKLSKDEKK